MIIAKQDLERAKTEIDLARVNSVYFRKHMQYCSEHLEKAIAVIDTINKEIKTGEDIT